MKITKIILFLNKLSLNKKNLKKALLTINFGIFLSIFAASSAIITLIVENRISNLEYEHIEKSRAKRMLERKEPDIARIKLLLKFISDTEYNEEININFIRLNEFGKKITSGRDLYTVKIFAIYDLIQELGDGLLLSDDELEILVPFSTLDENKAKKLFTRFNEFQKKYNKDIDANKAKYADIIFNSSYENLLSEINSKKNSLYDKLFEENQELIEFFNLFNEMLDFIQGIYLGLNLSFKADLDKVNEDIKYYSYLQKNLILIAFVLQLIIFLIIQYFEVNSLSKETKIKIKK